MIGGSLVAEARRRAGLTQAALAARLDVPQSTIARWETGRMAPSLDGVVRAVRACDLELSVALELPDRELEDLVEAHLRMTPAERFAQNTYLVRFVDGARQRIAAGRG